MARPVRIEFENAVYHVTARGNERRDIYRDDDDRLCFLETLEEAVERFGVVIHAFCLMPNHYHLLLQTDTDEEIRWSRRAGAQAVAEQVERLAAEQTDRRIAIWLNVRHGGRPAPQVAKEYGYRDSSGAYRVVKRLEARAEQDRELEAQLTSLRSQLSHVRS